MTGEAIKSLEPALSDDVKAVLVCPTGGIVCPFLMTIALAENAAVNGVSFRFDTTVKALSRNASDGHWNVLTAAGDTFEARCIINAAGVYADDTSFWTKKPEPSFPIRSFSFPERWARAFWSAPPSTETC